MLRDPGPSYNMGFGVNSRRDLPQTNTEQGMDPGSSFIAKALHDHPFLKFAAASTATIVGMHFAGSMIRKGGKSGLRLASSAAEASNSPYIKDSFANLSKEARSIRKTLDDWEGVFRADDGTLIPTQFVTSAGERATMRKGGDTAAEWGFRQEVQQRLVRQARRLPYELPAAYMVQRAPGVGTDDMFGYGDDQDRPDWHNPIDVVGDFAQQSVKNLASFMLPVEMGPMGAKEGWRRMLRYADGHASPSVNKLGANLDLSLKLVGHSAGDVLHSMMQVSQKTTSAMGSGIGEAIRHHRSTVESLHEMRIGAKSKGHKAWMQEQFAGGLGDNKLLDLVAPAGTSRRFYSGFKKVWNPITHGAVNKDSFDFKTANSSAYRAGLTEFDFHGIKGVKVDAKAARRASSSHTVIEQIAYNITSEVGRKGGLMPGIADLRGSTHYKRQMTDAYKRQLVDAVSDLDGMDYDQVRAVVQKLTVKKTPNGSDLSGIPLANRFSFGTLEQTQIGYSKALANELEKAVPGHGKKVIDALFNPNKSVLNDVDKNFLANMTQIENRVMDQWNAGFSQIILPFARRRLGDAIIPNEAFRDLSNPEVRDFLIRGTADRINKLAKVQGTAAKGVDVIPLTETHKLGTFKRYTGDIAEEIKRYGFDPDSPEQMRAFLTHQKVIAKKGSNQGFNAFGMRRLAVGDALDRGFFGEDISPTVRKLYSEMAGPSNPFGTASFRRMKVGNVWETTSGKTIDFSYFSSGIRKGMDWIGENLHIPFVKMSTSTFGAGAERSLAQTPILKMSGGMDHQPFTGVKDPTDMWIFTREGRSRGKLSRVFGGRQTEQLAGFYRNAPTDSSSMLGRHVRLGIGDQGMVPSDESQNRRRSFSLSESRIGKRLEKFSFLEGKIGSINIREPEGFKRWFSVDDHQPESIFQVGKNIKGGRTWREVLEGAPTKDPDNIAFLARMIADDSPDGRKAFLEYLKDNPSQAALTFESIRKRLRIYGLSDRSIDGILGDGSTASGTAKSVLSSNGKRISDLDSADFLESARFERGQNFLESDKTLRGRLAELHTKTIGRHEFAELTQDRYLAGESGSRELKRRGVFSRMDEVRRDFVRYRAISEGLRHGDFSRVASDMFADIENARMGGRLTKAEATEARAAVASMQIDFDEIMQSRAGRVRQDKMLDAAKAASAVSSKEVRGVFSDIAEHRMEPGALPGVRSFFKKRFGASEHRYEGTEYNPFGGNQDSVFMPTFGTVWDRNKAKATASVLGLNSWSDPESFSGSSIPMSHGFQRLDGFLSPFGMGLEETDFRGPLDFYARGLVGKRVLPIVAASTVALTADRTLGGMVHDRDQNGDRNYSPLILGAAADVAAEAQIALAAIPGGQSMAEKRYELEEGEVPIRRGRFWIMGNTPWKGGRIQYYRPSWYRRLKSGHMYTDETYGTPMERLAYGHDFSPLRPLDPYHYEDKHKNIRPYPTTGDYFTGPWGPITGALNATVGKLLKPTRKMHEEELEYKLSRYQQVGASGMAIPAGAVANTDVINIGSGVSLSGSGGSGGGNGVGESIGGRSWQGTGSGSGFSGSGVGSGTVAMVNESLSADASKAPANSPYGISVTPGSLRPKTIQSGDPMSSGSLAFHASSIGYNMQELMGIYGFAFGSIRSSLGLGTQDMSTQRTVLASPNRAYGPSRSFWDLSIGGLGDFTTPTEGSNLELSEFARRFLTRERSDVNYINPISNDMGLMHPWLPGSESTTNFKEGDPFVSIPMGEARLPGKGYEKLNNLHSDASGRYGMLDKFKILGDVAPYSDQYKAINKQIDSFITSPEDQALVDTVRSQVANKAKRHDFKPYEYTDTNYSTRSGTILKQTSPGTFMVEGFDVPIKLAGVVPDRSPEVMSTLNSLVGKNVSITTDSNRPGYKGMTEPVEAMISVAGENINKQIAASGGHETDSGKGLFNADQSRGLRKIKSLFEHAAHRDTFLNNKFLPNRTATEEWERQNVYGATFPTWSSPIDSYIMPSIYKSTNRGPIMAALGLGTIGSFFGSTKAGRVVGSMIGSSVGFGAGLLRKSEEMDTGDRFMPKHRKQEIGVEEYVDILSYVRSMKLKGEAEAYGDHETASNYASQAQRTMYGADLHGDIQNIIAAVPDRKRDYFKEMLNAPKSDRKKILSTAGRLERRLLQSAWGMDIEQRPNLEQYFSERELPGEDWSGWSPDVPMDNVKIKVAQSLGLDVSQMGYYPQQIRDANLSNMPYPDMQGTSMNQGQVQHTLQAMLYRNGLNGAVRSFSNGTNQNQLMLNAGVR